MRTFLSSLVLCALAACSSNDTTSSTDSGSPVDAAKDTLGPCGVVPAITCRPGAAGMACDIASKPLECKQGASQWTCPANTVSIDQCGCNTQGTSLQPGDPCPGAKDAAAE